MNRIDQLLANYRSHIQMPLRAGLPASQRVWFAVYPASEERRLVNRIEDFEILTNCTVLLIFRWSQVGFTAARTLRKAASDGAPETQAHGCDRPRDMALHRGETRAGGSLRIGQALGVERRFFLIQTAAPA